MTDKKHEDVGTIFRALDAVVATDVAMGLAVTSPFDGVVIARIAEDSISTLEEKITHARAAQEAWYILPRALRAAAIEKLAAAVTHHRERLAQLIHLEAGKTMKEALAEVDGSADILLKTVKDATLPEMGGMLRCKERPPVGVVGLITSFNFPLAVANWTIAPALLAGNSVLWKPSEKTPLTALGYKAVFDSAMGTFADLVQIVTGGRDIGTALVAHERIDMISATGSVAMGKGIKEALVKKRNRDIKPILELGGNNGVIISNKLSPAHLEWSLGSLMNSFLGTSGQRCTNTRRLIVYADICDQVITGLQKQIGDFLAGGAEAWEKFGYGALIDEDAYKRFERAKRQVVAEGGKIFFGQRLREKEYPDAYYIEPTLALLPTHSSIMHEETFAPLLFITPYKGDIMEAIKLVNAPGNAGLVNGIYTQNQSEADAFAAHNQAGHSVINSPKGTGTPAFGMGFGGNKDSGEGEILNAADPLRAFTRDTHFSRIAQNKDVAMDC